MQTAVIEITKVKGQRKDGSAELIDTFRGRGSRELVIAFAGPSGSDIASMVDHTKLLLKEMGYEDVVHIKLSNFIQQAIDDKLIDVTLDAADSSTSTAYKRYRSLQEGGKELRKKTGNRAILAEYAARAIRLDRDQRAASKLGVDGAPTAHAVAAAAADDDRPVPPGRVAYLVDQLKRPEEVALLRAIYRQLFFLVGVTRVADRRRAALGAEKIPDDKVARLMELDRKEADDDGQRLEQTLHSADYFIRNDATVHALKQGKIKRLLSLIHGDTSVSPTDHEQGMYVAYAAGLRSACLSRQVGAAIADPTGEIISTGCNDVPRAGGGLYGASKEGLDYRCVHHEAQYCFNDHYKRDLQEQISREMQSSFSSWPAELQAKLTPELLQKLLDDMYKNTRLGSLIEFSRSVHAEMDAIISAARGGAHGLVRGTLYTTTFPCHSCARHIVAAGITSVYYIEPYEKSLAKDLHGDSIAFEVEDLTEQETKEQKGIVVSNMSFLALRGRRAAPVPKLFQGRQAQGGRRRKGPTVRQARSGEGSARVSR